MEINAPAERVFAAAVDWRGQDRWIPATTVRTGKQAGIAIGGEIMAVTGRGPLSVLDTMTITRWDVPERVDVRHTGTVIRGTGTMRVVPLGPEQSRFYWAEDFVIPLGTAGKLGWALLKPAFAVGMRAALRRFARLVESGELGTTP